VSAPELPGPEVVEAARMFRAARDAGATDRADAYSAWLTAWDEYRHGEPAPQTDLIVAYADALASERSRADADALPPQKAALDFVRDRWPATTAPLWRAAKVAEEAGEVVGAVIKADQRLSGKTMDDVAKERAQVIICCLGLAESCGFDLVAEVWREWNACHERTWELNGG
jgi:NTP pyrophosphatase (non-canonical NTP hydrolase)